MPLEAYRKWFCVQKVPIVSGVIIRRVDLEEALLLVGLNQTDIMYLWNHINCLVNTAALHKLLL